MRTAAMKKAGTKPPLAEIVQKGSVAKAGANSVERRENEEKSRTGLSPPSASPPMGEREANLWVALHEDPSNLRMLIRGQLNELRSHQRYAINELRAGKKTKSLSLDEDNRLWYHPLITLT